LKEKNLGFSPSQAALYRGGVGKVGGGPGNITKPKKKKVRWKKHWVGAEGVGKKTSELVSTRGPLCKVGNCKQTQKNKRGASWRKKQPSTIIQTQTGRRGWM